MALLSVRACTKRFGGLVANENISFDVDEGALFAVIGPNGAGKTTLFNTISGTFPPTSGEILFADERISGLPQAKVAARGLIRTYQLVQLFKDMTVAENVMVGFHRVSRGGILAALLRPPAIRAQEKDLVRRTREILDFVGLSARADVRADSLPYGEQRLLEVARALAGVIERINATGVTVILIEHDMGLVMRIAQRIAVIDFGRKIAEGTPAEIRAHPDVIAAYLGGTEHVDA